MFVNGLYDRHGYVNALSCYIDTQRLITLLLSALNMCEQFSYRLQIEMTYVTSLRVSINI